MMKMTTQEQMNQSVMGTYGRFPVVIDHGAGESCADENGKTYQQLSIQLTSGEKFYYALSVSGTTQTITSADYDEWSLSANTDSLVYGLKEDVTEKYQTDYPKLEKAYATQFIQ